jgi:hypothetical protein
MQPRLAIYMLSQKRILAPDRTAGEMMTGIAVVAA